MKTSETTKTISEALAKAQKSIVNPKKLGKSNFGPFATLDDTLEVCREHCSANNISITQATRMAGDIMMLDTRLSCGNEWIEAEYPVIRFPARQQEIGSALTYSRRYSLSSLIGVAGDTDDDATEGNKAIIEPTITPEQQEELAALIEETKSDLAGFLAFMSVKRLQDIKAADFKRGQAALANKKGKA